jgi:siroheme decarboxylase
MLSRIFSSFLFLSCFGYIDDACASMLYIIPQEERKSILSKPISPEDKKIIRLIQGDLPVSPFPFAYLAHRAGMDEKEFLRKIRLLIRRGMIRRFGAILRHQIAGYRGNAMAVWNVPDEQIAQVSQTMTSFPAVSHCYLRPSHPHWPFNLYTMIHGKTAEDCRRTAKRISQETGIETYRLLFSKREHKKSSMSYFKRG